VLLNANERSRAKMTTSATTNLTGLALLVSSTMVTNSSNFWVVMSTWVTQLYRDLVGRGGHPSDTWKLLSQSMRKIFQELYSVREPGRGRIEAGDKPAAMVWGCLQGYQRAMTFLGNNIGQDLVLFHILNKHLQDNAAMKMDLTQIRENLSKTMEKLEALESTVEADKKLHDIVSTTVGILNKKK